jgi:predicted small lipoprotein YifL
MKIHSLILILASASALTACGQKPQLVAPAAPGEASASGPQADNAAVGEAEDRVARDIKRNADVHAMAARLADDPALLAKQTEACAAAPATNEPAALVVPCMAQVEAHDIIARRAQQSSGGVKNTGSL